MDKKIIIYTNDFNMNSGGVIVLHFLCNLLNKQGYNSFLWPSFIPILEKAKVRKSVSKIYRYLKNDRKRKLIRNKEFNTPIAKKSDLKDAIVVYPEVVDGNPLNAKNVVRWLLHKPGFHSGRIEYSKDDLLIGYNKDFIKDFIKSDEYNILSPKYIMTDIYKQTNFGERFGSCHMIRKGEGKSFVHDKGSLLVDNYTHEELADIFNEVKVFISYDTYTYYSYYASLCGCISIVIPDEGVTKEDWYSDERNRYGLSYGMNDIEYAKETRGKMIDYIKEQEEENNMQIKRFIKLCEEYFYNEY